MTGSLVFFQPRRCKHESKGRSLRGRESELATKLVIETQEDYALAVDRLKALQASHKSEEDRAEARALKAAIKTWDGRRTVL